LQDFSFSGLKNILITALLPIECQTNNHVLHIDYTGNLDPGFSFNPPESAEPALRMQKKRCWPPLKRPFRVVATDRFCCLLPHSPAPYSSIRTRLREPAKHGKTGGIISRWR
jgi:hypothetical protein